ncbi:polyphosphate kinase 1 [Oscillatoria sp. CS-180]|uniref:polyphosphate kinase 1 n=1 Tax=Oscillatoria sp. CS-180 TaxID=3021720 RepID=UPI00232F54FF|nr:polyphosphate kinase 1 [Oscillatoria sp. CS-180]MDB9527966.1 polyphosphate kinase 1 [Oscillatoria sp. CS-180]
MTPVSSSKELSDPQYYFNRELSWLKFNDRVLHEAIDPRTPFLERLKFIAIYSSNLDEFFMVRVSGLMDQVSEGVQSQTIDGLTPGEAIQAVRKHVKPQLRQQHSLFQEELRPQLKDHDIFLLNYDQFNDAQKDYLQHYFESQIFPVLTPLSVDPAHPFPRLSNLSLNLAAAVTDPETEIQKFARIKVPNNLPRFIGLPEELSKVGGADPVWIGTTLEEIIANNLNYLFPGMEISGRYLFRITRNADFTIREDDADDLLVAIEEEISKRRLDGFVCRLEVEESMPEELRQGLMQELNVNQADIYELQGVLNLKDLFFFLSMPLPHLKDAPWKAVVPPRLKDVERGEKSIFNAIRGADILLHHPYESFASSVQLFIAHAAHDPHVLTIKITLYRTSGDSPIVQSLIAAAENGKQVVALVELKARFDEQNNIIWARKLEDAGVHVVYGVVGLKTHTKTTLVVRREGDRIRRYVHIGTGNYNPKTSKLYTDLGLLSCREALGADLTDLFNFLTGYSRQTNYRKLLVAPLTLRQGMVKLIEREIQHVVAGKEGRIIAKMNSLVDQNMIQALYRASQVGVEIDLIIRGICCLRPGVAGISDRIRVISIIGRYLEHARIFYFANDGDEEFYAGSADWMPRNLDRRVEAVTPVLEPAAIQELKDILDIMLTDNRQAWELGEDGNFTQRSPGEDGDVRNTHDLLMERAAKRDRGGTIDNIS